MPVSTVSLMRFVILITYACIILVLSTSSAQIPYGGESTAKESSIVENIDAVDLQNVSNGISIEGSHVPARDEIYENVNIVISTEDEGTASNTAEGLYVDTVVTSTPDSYYESLTYPVTDAPAGGAHQNDQQNTSVAQAVGNGVEEVPEATVTSNEDSEDDETYLVLDQFKQGKCELTPADSAVLEDSYWYQPGIPR